MKSINVMATTQLASPASNARNWILSPCIDLLFACGGILWILFALHLCLNWGPAAGANAMQVTLLTLIGGLVFADTHNAATLLRLYGDRDIRTALPHVAYTSAAAFLVLGIICTQSPWLLGIALRVYLIFIAQHLTAQTYGISLIYCAKQGYSMTPEQRQYLQRTLQALAAFAVVRQFADPTLMRTSFQGISLPSWIALPEWILTLAFVPLCYCGFSFIRHAILKAQTDQSMLPLPVGFLLFTTVALFTIGPDVLKVAWLYAPAFFHGAQYLVVTTSVNLKQSGINLAGNKQNSIAPLLNSKNIEYWAILFVIALALYVILPCVCTRFGVDFSTAFASVFVAVSLHHFLADSAIWKLRDPKIRKLLV